MQIYELMTTTDTADALPNLENPFVPSVGKPLPTNTIELPSIVAVVTLINADYE